jgi:Inorganic pyrophosphatase
MLRVVIETPKGSRNKFAIDPDDHIFELKRVLPAGMTFPYDFGFVPSTTADDGAMQINVDPSVTGKTRWYEYAIRFLFGGLITPLAGIIAKKFGPVIGGLFLAFRRSFQPAQPLIEKHEKQKKKEEEGAQRGKEAASTEGAGSEMGSLGLLVFAVSVWQFATLYNTGMVLTGATLSWLTVSVLIWYFRKRM